MMISVGFYVSLDLYCFCLDNKSVTPEKPAVNIANGNYRSNSHVFFAYFI